MTRQTKSARRPNWPFVGQSELGVRLIAAMARNEFPVTVLFAGPAGLGKSAAATWLAKYDMCQGSTAKPCGTCLSCRQFASQTHPNFINFNGPAQENIDLDQIRRTLEVRRLRLVAGQHHWIVISAAERLTEGAANALLKFLEEPPDGFHCVLTSAAPDRLLPTIVSRCAVYYWHLASRAEIDQRVGPDKLGRRAIAARAAGRPDWIVEHLGDENLLAEEEQQVKTFIRAVTEGRAADLHQLIAAADDPSTATFDQWEMWLRELLLVKVGAGSRLLWPRLRGEISALAKATPLDAIMAKVNKIQERHQLLKQHLSPKIIASYVILG